MQLQIAVDFTASNLEPDDPKSLHSLTYTNQYEAAINMVGSVMLQYDFDQRVPLFGFGGIPSFMGETVVDHCFPLNGNKHDAEVSGGLEPLLKLYRHQLSQIIFYGPTLFVPILKKFKEGIIRTANKQMYHVLLILTDGCIHDMSDSKSLLVDLSEMPCSVIIVGVGQEDFDDMRELDGDSTLLVDDDDRKAERDIVQFVEFS